MFVFLGDVKLTATEKYFTEFGAGRISVSFVPDFVQLTIVTSYKRRCIDCSVAFRDNTALKDRISFFPHYAMLLFGLKIKVLKS